MTGVATLYRHTRAAKAEVCATPAVLFDYLDDAARLGAHMEKPSMMMMGGRMTYAFDEAEGRATGSVIKMGGAMLGIKLSVEEIVTEYDPPRRKVWETEGHPRILIMGRYRMGFEITPTGDASSLRIFIDYDFPEGFGRRVLGTLLAPLYARWCVRRMADDAKQHFARLPT
jgi:hypothetical protein